MSDLYEFVLKRTANISDITCRKLYGLDAFYISDKPFIVISAKDQIIVKVEDFEVRKSLQKIPNIELWKLGSKIMEDWFVLPETYNKKKNKLSPVIEMTAKVLLNPKKKPKKKKVKSKKIQMTPKRESKVKEDEPFLKKLFKKIFK